MGKREYLFQGRSLNSCGGPQTSSDPEISPSVAPEIPLPPTPPGALSPSAMLTLARTLHFGQAVLPDESLPFAPDFSNGHHAWQKNVRNTGQALPFSANAALEQQIKNDAVIVTLSLHASARQDFRILRKIDDDLYRSKHPVDTRRLTARTGKILAEQSLAITSSPNMALWFDFIRLAETPGTYPVTLGVFFADLNLHTEQALMVHQSGLIMNIISEIIQLIRNKDTNAQEAKISLRRQCEDLCARMAKNERDTMTVYATVGDVLSSMRGKNYSTPINKKNRCLN